VAEEEPVMSERPPHDPAPVPPEPATQAEDAAARAERAARQAEQSKQDASALAAAARDAAVEAARRAGRFSREFLVTVISVVTTAFGVVVALAWNTALTKALEHFSGGTEVAALFVYALLITFLAVLAIVIMSRIARRIGAEPVPFTLLPKKD
jgi:hypothetical protein